MSIANRRPRVTIIQQYVPVYRVQFHEDLKVELDRRGIDLTLIHGNPYGDDLTRNDQSAVSYATVREHRVLRLGGKDVTWLPSYQQARTADLVICEQHSARLSNYPLWLRYLAGRQLFAFWGHGKNFRADSVSKFGEWLKRFMSRHVHWWFAYNDLSASVVKELGFPADRITSVQNAVDTRALAREINETTPAQLDDLRSRHGITGDNVCIFVGSMYTQKRMAYLLEACDHIRAQIDDFEILFLGGGPDRRLVTEAAGSRPWMHDIGATFDAEKAPYLRLGKLLLIPGLVGLTILDAFAAGIPLVTVADAYHSPEIDYLDDGRNGRMLPPGTDPVGYAESVVALLRDDTTRKELAEACRHDSERYTIEAMVDRFATGIERALRAARR